MSDDARVTLKLDDIEKALDAWGSKKLGQTIGAGVRLSVLQMVAHVTKNKMRGQYLGRVTGTAIRSVTQSPFLEILEDRVVGGFGSHLGYVRAHELGYSGTVAVPGHAVRAHQRRVVRPGRKRRARIQVREHERRAHSRRVNFRARHFFRDTLVDKLVPTSENLKAALLELARTGKAPTVKTIRARFS